MTKDQKRRWVKALRSGKYRQGVAMLKNDIGEYCCLGVARDFCGARQLRNGTQYLSSRYLPNDIQRSLAMVNDYGVPFDMIAGLINEALEPTE